MITIKDLKTIDTGKWVIYKSYGGEEQKGRIKTWNDKFIFVVYNCGDDWDNFLNYTSCCTNPADLCFLATE